MSLLSGAIREEQWELAALCLLMGLARALSRLPADSIIGLMEVVEGHGEEPGDEAGRGFLPGRPDPR